MGVQNLLLELDVRVVHEDGDADTEHEGHIAREHIPNQHGNDRNRENHVKEEELRASQFAELSLLACLDLDRFLGLREFAVQTCAARLLLNTGENRVCQCEDNTEDLNRQQLIPELTCLHAEHRSRTHRGTCPGHQVQNTHREDRNAEQRSFAHVHFLVDRQHGGDYNQEGRSAAAVQVADDCDDCGHDRDTDHVVADQLHELADDHIEEAGIRHDAEEEDGEDKERSRGTRTLKAVLNERRNILKCVVAAEHQNQCEYRREEDESNAREGFALKERHDNGNDCQKPEYAYGYLVHTACTPLV